MSKLIRMYSKRIYQNNCYVSSHKKLLSLFQHRIVFLPDLLKERLTCKKSVLHFQVYNGTSETTASCCISELLTFPSVLLKYCILILSRPHESEIPRTVFLEISYTCLSQLKNFTSLSYHNETNSEHKAEGPHEELGLLWSAIQRS